MHGLPRVLVEEKQNVDGEAENAAPSSCALPLLCKQSPCDATIESICQLLKAGSGRKQGVVPARLVRE